MSLLEFSQLAFGYSDERIIVEATGALHPGEIVGLVGANACGKTTLLRLLLNRLSPEEGRVQRGKSARIAYVSQSSQGGDADELFEFARAGHVELMALSAEIDLLHQQLDGGQESAELIARLSKAEERFAALDGHRWETNVERLLTGLSFTTDEFTQTLGTMSGGQRQKACLARELLSDSNCLVFDEPTNHLDLYAQDFFVSYLKGLPQDRAVLLVSHDRWLLDAICSQIWELDGGTLYRYKGSYSKYVPKREARRTQARQAFARQREEIARTEDYIRRNIAGQNTRQAQGRRKLLNRMERLEEPGRDPQMKFLLQPQLRPGEQLLIVENLAFGYSEPGAEPPDEKGSAGVPPAETGDGGRDARPAYQGYAGRDASPTDPPPTYVPVGHKGLSLNPPLSVEHSTVSEGLVVDNMDFTIYRGERLGIVGPNGCGKSTLLKLIARQLLPARGMIAWGANAELGIFSQDSSDLSPGLNPLGEMRTVEPGISDSESRDYLARFGFSGDDVSAQVGTLSGGERSRLSLAKIFRRRPNVLLLDEPTNHLDIYAREALEQFLGAYLGSVILITHDRALLERICDRIIVFIEGEGGVMTTSYFRGGYRDYLQWRKRQAEAAALQNDDDVSARANEPAVIAGRPDLLTLAEVEVLARQSHTSAEAYCRKQAEKSHKRITESEEKIATHEQRIRELQDEQIVADRGQEYGRIGELQNEIDSLNELIEEAFSGMEQEAQTAQHWEGLLGKSE